MIVNGKSVGGLITSTKVMVQIAISTVCVPFGNVNGQVAIKWQFIYHRTAPRWVATPFIRVVSCNFDSNNVN